MNINVGVLGLLALALGAHVLYAWWVRPLESNPHQLPWVPIDVRKTKVYVSQTRDAGMFVERQRRQAVLRNRPFRPSSKGFTNGVMDVRLTGIVFDPYAICGPPKPVVWDAGDADDGDKGAEVVDQHGDSKVGGEEQGGDYDMDDVAAAAVVRVANLLDGPAREQDLHEAHDGDAGHKDVEGDIEGARKHHEHAQQGRQRAP